MSDPNGSTLPPASDGASHDPPDSASSTAPFEPILKAVVDSFEKRLDTHSKANLERFEKLQKEFSSAREPKSEAKKAESQPSLDEIREQLRTELRAEQKMARRLGEATAGLNEGDREVIDEMLSDGVSYEKAIRYAERLSKEVSPSREADATRVAPPGVAATSAPRSSQVEHPKSMVEYSDLNRTAHERETHGQNKGALTARAVAAARKLDLLEKDPTFDPSDLPRR